MTTCWLAEEERQHGNNARSVARRSRCFFSYRWRRASSFLSRYLPAAAGGCCWRAARSDKPTGAPAAAMNQQDCCPSMQPPGAARRRRRRAPVGGRAERTGQTNKRRARW